MKIHEKIIILYIIELMLDHFCMVYFFYAIQRRTTPTLDLNSNNTTPVVIMHFIGSVIQSGAPGQQTIVKEHDQCRHED